MKIRFLLRFSFLLIACSLFGQNTRVDGVVYRASGFPAAGALIAVCTQPAVIGTSVAACTPLASLCSSASDAVCTSPNPVTADGLGNYNYYAKPGKYSYQFYGSGLTTRLQTDQVIPCDPTSACTFSIENNNRIVDCALTLWAGADCGAKINSADTSLGATYGELWIMSGGTMTTQILPRSGHTYRFFPGTYNFPTPLLFTSLIDFKVICEPGCFFNNTQTGYNHVATVAPLLEVDSGNAVVSPTLTANGNVGVSSITVSSGTSLVAGQQIAIFDTRFAEINQIASSYVSGTTVPLVRQLENNYTTARGAQISLFNWASNFLIRGVVATGTSASGTAVLINNALDGNIEDITCTSGGGRCYLSRLYSSRLHALNIHASNASDNSIENYITTSHNVVQNCWATNSLSNGIAVHGFHETLYNCHSWGNVGAGLQIDSGQFINVVGGEYNSNAGTGITISGAALNTTEATDVTLNGVQIEDNTGDGLSAGTGGNVRVNLSGGIYARNRGTHGNMYLNAIAPGSILGGFTNWGATNNGIAFDGGTTSITLGPFTFQGPTANGVADINLINAGTLDFSTIFYGNNSTAPSFAGSALGVNNSILGGRADVWQLPTGIGTFRINGNIMSGVAGMTPFTASTYDLGSLALPWRTIYGGGAQLSLVTANLGTACTNGELALGAGWQSTGTATVTAVAGTGQTCSWTITTGTTTAANPTITDTLTNALPTATTVCWMNIYGGTHTAVAGESLRQTTLSATAPIFTANFTPTAAGTTYFVTRGCGP